MRILVADDSIVSRHVLDATLRKWGYDVVMASDGEEAWQILQRDDAPRLVILDWMMPGMTGLEICRLVRARAPEPYIYILLLTSKSHREDLIEGMEAGADDYITKPFDQHELKVRLRAGTRLVELQAELFAAREALREQATKDWLTKLWNRSSILDILMRELARSERDVSPVSVALLDLDHFKSVNDTLGHYAGDIVLRETAVRMNDSVRQYDSIGRYGGEEFLIVLPGCDLSGAISQAERLCGRISGTPVTIGPTETNFTASIGVTTSLPGQSATADALIGRADEALYQAKRKGRNRVESLAFEPETASAPQHEALTVKV
ncbi:MAG TPA: diguanylate cyclase [Bryobacteraceae bacterium]|nr:diguanylate cyclase [Bryobacteraceae bacterium]